MDLTPYVAALRDDLAAAAAVGDEATTRAGTSLAAALEPAVRLALMNALSDLAGEVSAALEDRTVSLRLSGRQVEVVVDRGAAGSAGEGADGFFAGPASSPFAGTPSGGPGGPHRHSPPPPPGPGFGGEGSGSGGFGGFGGFGGRGGPDVGDISRMTLRLVDQIKGQAERAAASQGMSLNSWIAQAVQGALQDKHRRGGWGGWDGGGREGGGWGGWGGWDAGSGSTGDGPSGPGPSGTSGGDSPTPGPSGTPGPSAGDDPERGDEGGPDGGVDGWVRG